MWRINRDESKYSAKKLLSWHWALPHKHLPIIEADEHEARKFEAFISEVLTGDEIEAIVKRLGLKEIG